MAKNNTKLVEEKVEVVEKPKRRKKLNSEQVVDEIIKNTNLPVYEKEKMPSDFLNFEEPQVKKKEKINRKKILQEEKRKREELERKILEGDNAAYVQVVKDKGKTKKIIRYNTDLNTGLTADVVEHRRLQGLSNKKERGSTKSVPRIVLSNTFTFFNLLNFAIAAWIISAKGVGAWKYIFFIVIVMANLIISIVQEIRSKNIIDKLSIMSAPTAHVLRDSESYDVPVDDVVASILEIITK